jgi:hypothetical protein
LIKIYKIFGNPPSAREIKRCRSGSQAVQTWRALGKEAETPRSQAAVFPPSVAPSGAASIDFHNYLFFWGIQIK